MTPLVSVIVPTRDRLTSLKRALAGVDTQGFRDFEVIVVDDGSEDGTTEWVRSHRPDVRLLTSTRSAGAAAARNRALSDARGELLAFLDSDDLWHPSYLEAQVAQLDRNPDAALSYTDHLESHTGGRRTRPNNGTLLPDSGQLERLLAEAFIHTLSTVVCHRGALDRLGGSEKGLTIATRGGAQVTAPCDGWVVYAASFRNYGQVLILNAGGGYHVVLAGMERISVDVGQFVLTGEPVAIMGSGSQVAATLAVGSNQPVLYVEFRKDGNPVDPSPWWAASEGEKVRG